MSAYREILTKTFPDLKEKTDLGKLTTFKGGGKAEFFLETGQTELIRQAFELSQRENFPLYLLGKGSNLLINEVILNGLVIRFNSKANPVLKNDHIIRVSGGCSLTRLLKFSLQHNLAGMQGAAGIPGSVGGALKMNASSALGEVSRCLKQLTILDQQGEHQLTRAEIDFSYRTTSLTENSLILEAVFELEKYSPVQMTELHSRIKQQLQKRSESQPLDLPSFGSVFKNPPHEAAGSLIEKAGLKGVCLGETQISEKHANFIVNLGQGKAVQAYELIHLAQKKVMERFSIALQPEVKLWGFTGRADNSLII